MAINKGYEIREDLKELVMETPMEDVVFMADEILPTITVNQRAGQKPVLSTSAGMKQLDLKKAPRGTFRRTEWVWGKDTFTTAEYGYEEMINNLEALENSEIFDEEQISAPIAVNQLKLAREKRVSDAVLNASVFSGTNDAQAVTGGVWTAAAAAIWADVEAAYQKLKIKIGRPKSACVLAVSEDIFRQAMRSTGVREDVKYTSDINSAGTEKQRRYLADFLGIKEVKLLNGVVDTQPEGVEDAVFADIWSKTISILYVPSPASLNSWKVAGLGRQPVWKKFSIDYRIETYDEEQSDSRIVRAREVRGEDVNTKFGCIITGISS